MGSNLLIDSPALLSTTLFVVNRSAFLFALRPTNNRDV